MWDSEVDPAEFDFDVFLADLINAHQDATKNKRHTLNTLKYETYSLTNTIALAHDIEDRTYAPSRGLAFINREPVIREIFCAPFRDRVVHHYIYNKTIDWWIDQFIPNTYSCIKGRGAIQAINDVYAEMQQVSKDFTEEAYYIKLDLQGYFMSLNRKKLLKCALAGLRRQYQHDLGVEYQRLRYLWTQICLDDPVRDAKFRDYPHDWKHLPPSKSLINQAPGVGIVIGNLTSQLLSNIFLNSFDWYVYRTLGYQNYNRYVDDFVIIVNHKDLKRALSDLKKIDHYLKGMGLTLHPKKREIQPIHHGLKFLGFRIYPGRSQAGTILPGRIIPGTRLSRNIRRTAKLYKMRCANGESLISYLGLISHFDAIDLHDLIVDSLDY